MQQRWTITPYDPILVNELSASLSVSPLLARLLLNRGFQDKKAAKTFIETSTTQRSSPLSLLNMGSAIRRILTAIKRKEKIVIYGDYDVDGICATVLLRHMFRLLQYDVDYYIPSRFHEGYGMNAKALRHLKESDVDLIITVDNGITSRDLVAEFKELDFIITDHHRLPKELPDAIIVNPQLEPEPAAFSGLCGCGVAYFLAEGVLAQMKSTEPAHQLSDLTALATIADIVPLRYDNRILVRDGLQKLRQASRPGIAALLKVCGIDPTTLRATDVAFQLAPRINACGRMDQVDLAVALLEATDGKEAERLATQINGLNDQRKTLESTAFQEAVEQLETTGMIDCKAIVVKDATWHQGVIGIVASRLTDRYHLPALVFTQDQEEPNVLKASGRSVPGLDLYATLQGLAPMLRNFGGHEMAAGLAVQADRYAEFQEAFEAVCVRTQDQWLRAPEIIIDAAISPKQLTITQFREIEQLEPFGCGNPEPVFLVEGAEVLSSFFIGKQQEHRRMTLRVTANETIDCVYFRAPKDLKIQVPGRYDLVLRFARNQFRGEIKLECHVVDMLPAWMGERQDLNDALAHRKKVPLSMDATCVADAEDVAVATTIDALTHDNSAEVPWMNDAIQGLKEGQQVIVTADTVDAVWRFHAQLSQHLPPFWQSALSWRTAKATLDQVGQTVREVQSGKGGVLFATQAFYDHHQSIWHQHQSIKTLNLNKSNLAVCSDQAANMLVQAMQRPRQSRMVELISCYTQGKPTLVYARSLKSAILWTKQLRSFLPRAERDRAAALMPQMNCSEMNRIINDFNEKRMGMLFVSDQSPWSQVLRSTQRVILLDPCFSLTTLSQLIGLLPAQVADSDSFRVLFEDEGWHSNAQFLMTHYPNRTWLGKFYHLLQRILKEQSTQLSGDPKMLFAMFPQEVQKRVTLRQLHAGLQILQELSLIEVVKDNNNRYINFIKTREKRDLMASCLYKEGEDARLALAALATCAKKKYEHPL